MAETAYIVQPDIVSKLERHDLQHRAEEAEGLAAAINLQVVQTKIAKVSKIQAGYFLAQGNRDTIKAEIEELKPDIVVFNYQLSPIQQRNLEKEWNAKVIDRTGLILEIFGARAQTKEGRLQVELAALEYQRSRLVRSWTHLERQRGGAGFMGGPGETQIELDRRIINDKIIQLKKNLEQVRRTRAVGRKSRQAVPLPVVALVGYTNAGKSTLFNRLTGANVFAKDLLFATLDPTMRRLDLPRKQTVILSDTVGFITDLPTHLIESFKATLEQIDQADVIVHVRDVSAPYFEDQKTDVVKILEDLGIQYESDKRIVEVYNKADLLLEGDKLEDMKRKVNFQDNALLISAHTGEGIPELLDKLSRMSTSERVAKNFTFNPEEGKAISWIYDHAEVLKRTDKDGKVKIKAMIDPLELGKFKQYFKKKKS